MRVRARRLHKFEEQLPDAIDLFTRTMRAGHNIHSGLETIATETADPVQMEFKKLMEELALGSQVEPALHNLGKRVPLIDLKFFITGLILQRQTGANMVAVLENLATLVRERLNMAAKMKAHTAQQRFSAGLLCGMPLVVGDRVLDSEAGVHPAAVHGSDGQQVSDLRDHFGDRGHSGDPQDRQHPGVSMMLTCICLLPVRVRHHGHADLVRRGDVSEPGGPAGRPAGGAAVERAWWWPRATPRRPHRRRLRQQFPVRAEHAPGWTAGCKETQTELNQAGMRSKQALAVYAFVQPAVPAAAGGRRGLPAAGQGDRRYADRHHAGVPARAI